MRRETSPFPSTPLFLPTNIQHHHTSHIVFLSFSLSLSLCPSHTSNTPLVCRLHRCSGPFPQQQRARRTPREQYIARCCVVAKRTTKKPSEKNACTAPPSLYPPPPPPTLHDPTPAATPNNKQNEEEEEEGEKQHKHKIQRNTIHLCFYVANEYAALHRARRSTASGLLGERSWRDNTLTVPLPLPSLSLSLPPESSSSTPCPAQGVRRTCIFTCGKTIGKKNTQTKHTKKSAISSAVVCCKAASCSRRSSLLSRNPAPLSLSHPSIC